MANNRIQIKRTNVSGRAANNTTLTNPGELALNMADGILYSTNGSSVFEIGANLTNQNISGNLTVAAVIANGSIGSPGQTLATNGSAVYWSTVAGTGTVTQVDSGDGLTGGPITGTGTLSVVAGNNTVFVNSSGVYVNTSSLPPGVNLDSQYTWTNTQTFTNTITFNSVINGTANVSLTSNNSTYLNGNSASDLISYADVKAGNAYSNATSYADTAAATAYSNATSYADAKAGNAYSNATSYADAKAGNAYSNAVSYVDGKAYVNTSQLSGNLANYQTTAGLSANVATLTSNLATYVVANNGIVSNSSGVFAKAANGISVDSSGINVVAGNTQLVSNTTGVWIDQTKIDHNSLSNYDANKHVDHTAVSVTAGSGLTGGGTIAASRTIDVGAGNGISVAADAVYVNGGSTTTVNTTGVHVNSTLSLQTLTTTGNVTIGGNLTVSGNVTVIGANNLSIVDNFIYLNSNNTTQNIDLGFAGNYNDGTYKHAGFFRDASDGYWKPFDGYTPEPDAAVDIDTSNNTFNIAGMWFGNTRIGNTTVYATVNSTVYSGTANNSTNFGGYTWAAPGLLGSGTANGAAFTYANVSGQVNAASLQISGNSTLSGANNTVNAEFRVVNSTANVFFAAANGNIGIGNTNPAHKLRVTGTTSLAGAVSDITTLAAGNTTITGFANVSSDGQFSGNVGIGVAPSSIVGLYTVKTWSSDAVLYGIYTGLIDSNTSMTSARIKSGSSIVLSNQNQNKSSDGLTTYNGRYYASFNDAYNGSSATGGDAFCQALYASLNRSIQYANGANANTVTDARGSYNQVIQLGSGVISSAFGTVSQVTAGNNSVTGNVTSAFGIYSDITSNTAMTIGTGYLYYGIHQGTTTTTKWGIYLTGETQNYFSGNVGIGTTSPAYKLQVNGSFAATTKSFVIDHPTKTDMKLRYGSLEGPENGVYVRGKLEGKSIIELPEYWWNLIDQDTITVNLTPYGRSQDIWVQSTCAHFIHLNQQADCFFTVYAERKDVDKLVVEF